MVSIIRYLTIICTLLLRMSECLGLPTDPLVSTKNQVDVMGKLEKFVKSGVKNFQIVADFDYTMTNWHPTGTCFSVIRTYPEFPKEFLSRTEAIKKKYLAVHIDNTLPDELRYASDAEWFQQVMGCFKEVRFHRDMIPAMLEASSCRLREGVVEFLRLARDHGIPVLVFSGGIRDVIEVLLEREGCYFDNISIISNKLLYDDQGVMIGAEQPHMTASNKLDVARENVYFSDVIRDHVLLLGDMLADLKMASCVQYTDMISMGFCNIDKDKEVYGDKFDVVMMGNPGFGTVNQVLKQIIGSSKQEL